MHEEHRQAAQLHDLAARAHRTAAEHNEKGDYPAAVFHSERALEYSDQAYKLAKEARSKSEEIVSL
jgi:HEPN domain-containing protein